MTDSPEGEAGSWSMLTNHGIQVRQLMFLEVANGIQLETDLTFSGQ